MSKFYLVIFDDQEKYINSEGFDAISEAVLFAKNDERGILFQIHSNPNELTFLLGHRRRHDYIDWMRKRY